MILGMLTLRRTLIFFPMIFLSFQNFSCCYNFLLFKNLLLYICFLIYLFVLVSSVRNSPRQSANAEPFAEAYLHFIVFALAIKIFLKKVFLELKKIFFVKEKKIFIKKTFLQDTNYSRASIFIIHTFISYIFNSLL